jgi:hypothetical protein
VVAIFLSLIGGVFLMQVFGFTLNLLTLLAIVLSVGLVVEEASDDISYERLLPFFGRFPPTGPPTNETIHMWLTVDSFDCIVLAIFPLARANGESIFEAIKPDYLPAFAR